MEFDGRDPNDLPQGGSKDKRLTMVSAAETNPETTLRLRDMALSCRSHFRKLCELEDSDTIAGKPTDFWASQQFTEFEIWCSKVGVDRPGAGSLDMRLKDVPELCSMFDHLLSALERSLVELENPQTESTTVSHIVSGDIGDSASDGAGKDDNPKDEGSDSSSSLSFDSLSSLDNSEGQETELNPAMKRKVVLRERAEDTINRLRDHALGLPKLSVQHRQQRLALYRQKEEPKMAFDGFKRIAKHRANEHFKLASENVKELMAESFARRRIKFNYVEQHRGKLQKQSLLSNRPNTPPEPPEEGGSPGEDLPTRRPEFKTTPEPTQVLPRPLPMDQRTIFSATEITRLEPLPPRPKSQRAESVASVLIRDPGFPPAPNVIGGTFECPYCHVDLVAGDAEAKPWFRHLLQDFEPYFCTVDNCKDPFGFPNTFDGLMAHLQSHVPFKYHLDTPDGEHMEFDRESEFENQVREFHGGDLLDEVHLDKLKKSSLRRGIFMFHSCPFCGGFPDDLEKDGYSDPTKAACQTQLRRHVDLHMQQLIKFLPPFREDLVKKDMAKKGSAEVDGTLSDNGTAEHVDLVETECEQEDCSCHYDADRFPGPPDMDAEGDFWREMAGLYSDAQGAHNRSEVPTAEFLERWGLQLHEFIAASDNNHASLPDANKIYIGWISALPIELTAATFFLDTKPCLPEKVARNDSNSYVVGKVGRHNVVMACLPDGEYGTAAASVVAANMLRSFPNIRFGLMVGIGGGAPGQTDMHLGDIVVGNPSYNPGAVLQYDFGKAIQNQMFATTGHLGQPRMILLTTLAYLRSRQATIGHCYEAQITEVLAGKSKRTVAKFSRPNPTSDRLYRPEYTHSEDNLACEICCGDSSSVLVPRPKREMPEDGKDSAVVHYGLIASANQRMKDAAVRDSLAAEKGVLCFETEAAGLMDNFPCLVIRGICDYSDSHQNKDWQGFAAMMASAYAKDLLNHIARISVQKEKAAREVVGMGNGIEHLLRQHALATNDAPASLEFQASIAKLKRRLSPADPSTNINRARKLRHPGTGDWILGVPQFLEWCSGSGRRQLWLHGPVGCGKTVLSTRILDHLADRIVLAFFFDFSDPKKRTTYDMLLTLAFQASIWLIRLGKGPERFLQSSASQPSIAALWKSLPEMLADLGEVIILLDALDGLTMKRGLLDWIRDTVKMRELGHVRLIVTSRPEYELQEYIPAIIGKDNCLPLDEKAINRDIRSYVKARLLNDASFRSKLPTDGILAQEICQTVGDKAGPMFLWARCQLATLSEGPGAIQDCLDKLPKGLAQTYHRLMESIPSELKRGAMRLLLFLVHSGRPIRVREARDVIGTQAETKPRVFNHWDRPFNRPIKLLRYCPSMVTLENDDAVIQLIHPSLKDYLIGLPEFQDPDASISITWTCLTYLMAIDPDVDDIDAEFPLRAAAWELWKQHGDRAEVSDKIVEESVRVLRATATTPVLEEVMRLAEEYTPSPLAAACAGGFPKTARRLMEEGIEPGLLSEALCITSARGHEEMARLLLENGSFEPYSLSEALRAASARGHVEIARLLLGRGKPFRRGTFSDPLYAASAGGHEEMVRLLLGTEGFWQPEALPRALHIASAKGYAMIARLLLEKGSFELGSLSKALGIAAAKGHEQIVRLLLEKGLFEPDTLSQALRIASAEGNHGIVRLLLEDGAEVDTDCEGT
ncbi:hypothetical protein MAPG_04516 [Magnaporthiopsis poae ATCC 64411]|uniref:Nephrocystin 3-like N-terminal domain-containing protein n=1 Tax=Magnaporthiopsis poae (strain ATCC 64411 / 73-15) TaxID=644358 RepID=A0A0C4DWY2_MAGP6|nr:hypothetical protein MAPG_04516 [Magnaporthiopsis poae ATCC 64411]